MKLNNFPFGELLKKAWQWTIKNKILWIIAFFAGSGGFAMNLSLNNSDKKVIQNIFENSGMIKEKISMFWADMGNFIFFIFSILVFFLLFFLLSLAMNAAVIQANKKIQNNESYKFWSLVKSGFSFLPRMLLLSVLWGIPNLILLILMIVGLGFSLTASGAWSIALFGIAMIVGLIYNLFIWLLRHNAYCFAVLENNNAWTALKNSTRLLFKNFGIVLMAGLIEIGLSIAIGLGIIISLIILAIPFVILGGLLMFVVGGWGILVPVILGALISLCLLVVIRGASSFLFNIFLTNVYWEISK